MSEGEHALPVSQEACRVRHEELQDSLDQRAKLSQGRHSFMKWAFGIIISIMGLFVAGAGLCFFTGTAANRKATEVEYQLQANEKVFSQKITSVKEDMTEIKRDIEKQGQMIEDIWRKNGGSHP
jgi:hypothetical protein